MSSILAGGLHFLSVVKLMHQNGKPGWSIWVSIPVPRPCEGRALPIAPIPRHRLLHVLLHVRVVGPQACDLARGDPPASASRLAQLVERKTLNLVVVGSSPTVGVFFIFRLMQTVGGAAACTKGREFSPSRAFIVQG